MAIDLSTVTVSDFKSRFRRDFPYLPTWDDTVTYNKGDTVFQPDDGLFYVALSDGVTSEPPGTDWDVVRDSKENYVEDVDISNAFDEAGVLLNQSLFPKDDEVKLGYLYLTAHFLTIDLRAAKAGIGGTASFPVQSRSAGSVSEAYSIPETFTKDPILSQYTQTHYGYKYLQLIQPRLVGNVITSAGGTQA